MSSKTEINAVFRMLSELDEKKAQNAPLSEIEKLQDDIGDLQMNILIGDLADED